MYKIEIEWGFRSPTLRVLTGEVRIGNIEMGKLKRDPEFPPFSVRKDHRSRGYTNCPAILNRCQPLVDLMVDSYYSGMLMSDTSYNWFVNSSRKNNEVFLTMLD
jgi:hypothetical protein